MNQTSSPFSVDLSFVALLFAVLSASSEYKTSRELFQCNLIPNEERMDEYLERFYSISITMLGLSDFGERPTINGLQAVAMLSHYAFARRKQKSYGSLLVMSLRLAETLGLHRLGTAEDDARRWAGGSNDDNSSNSGSALNPSFTKVKDRRLSSTSKDSGSSSSLTHSSGGKPHPT